MSSGVVVGASAINPPEREGARKTRIDGVIANSMAAPYIRAFNAEKHPMMPTRSVVHLHVDLNMGDQPRSFAKTLPSLKSVLDKKIAGEGDKIEYKKEKVEKAKQMKRGLHDIMGLHLTDRRHHMQHYTDTNDTDGF